MRALVQVQARARARALVQVQVQVQVLVQVRALVQVQVQVQLYRQIFCPRLRLRCLLLLTDTRLHSESPPTARM